MESLLYNMSMAKKMTPKDKKSLMDALSGIMMGTHSMEKAMQNLTEEITRVHRGATFVTALGGYPNRVCIDSDHQIWLDTLSFRFTVGEILEYWQSANIPTWMTNHLNEIEDVDTIALIDQFKTWKPEMTMTAGELLDVIRAYLDHRYLPPVEEQFSSFNATTMEQKDYFLPGLKVLNVDEHGTYWSPSYPVPWNDGELLADHLHKGIFDFSPEQHHKSIADAMQTCDCGIYASVNMNELSMYLTAQFAMGMDGRFGISDRRLCMIEPFSDATVWTARKGWKASKAFISEVIGETISIRDASALLSMVWQRPIDINEIYKGDL